MTLKFSLATPADAPALAALHTAAAADLTRRFGHGFWSSATTERGVLASMRHSRVLLASRGKTIVGTLRLANKKPWAIDVSYFTPVKKAIYLTGMAVNPRLQRQGIGRLLLVEAVAQARAWPAPASSMPAVVSAKLPMSSTKRTHSSTLSLFSVSTLTNTALITLWL
jgi:predicted N-acetyltransferase YhbS